jgi:hypothetical protein
LKRGIKEFAFGTRPESFRDDRNDGESAPGTGEHVSRGRFKGMENSDKPGHDELNMLSHPSHRGSD